MSCLLVDEIEEEERFLFLDDVVILSFLLDCIVFFFFFFKLDELDEDGNADGCSWGKLNSSMSPLCSMIARS